MDSKDTNPSRPPSHQRLQTPEGTIHYAGALMGSTSASQSIHQGLPFGSLYQQLPQPHHQQQQTDQGTSSSSLPTPFYGTSSLPTTPYGIFDGTFSSLPMLFGIGTSSSLPRPFGMGSSSSLPTPFYGTSSLPTPPYGIFDGTYSSLPRPFGMGSSSSLPTPFYGTSSLPTPPYGIFDGTYSSLPRPFGMGSSSSLPMPFYGTSSLPTPPYGIFNGTYSSLPTLFGIGTSSSSLPRPFGMGSSSSLPTPYGIFNVTSSSSSLHTPFGIGTSSSLPTPFGIQPQQAANRRRGNENFTDPPAKRGRGRLHRSGDSDWTTHIIDVEEKEDIVAKVIAYTNGGQRSVCVLSATGAVSQVTIPKDSLAITHKDVNFEIISLSGSFVNGVGNLSVTFAIPNRPISGGRVIGKLIAARRMQVLIGSFVPESGGQTGGTLHLANRWNTASGSREPVRDSSWSSGGDEFDDKFE